MENRKLSIEEQGLFKQFLNLKDLETIAEHTGFSTSTVNNLMHRRVKFNNNTLSIMEALNVACYAKMMEVKEVIGDNAKHIKKLKAVKEYIKLEPTSKWI